MAPEPGSGRPLEEPHPSRLPPDHPRRDQILAAHREAMAAGEPGYTDPDTGLFVMTAAQLLSRSACCQSGCRHCPYVVSGADPAPGRRAARDAVVSPHPVRRPPMVPVERPAAGPPRPRSEP